MSRPKLSLLFLLGLVSVGTWWFNRPDAAQPAHAGATPARNTASTATPTGSATTGRGATPSPAQKPAARLAEVLAQLAASPDAATSRRLLAELRAFLDRLPAGLASREVQSFLAAGRDAPTKLDVTVKPGGALGDASSLRVFLMDYLGQVDRAAAGQLARQTLSAPTSPDEWAVSLRNVAWSDDSPATAEFIRAKARELLQNPAWKQNPSAGYLEAFDAIVYAKGFDLAPELTGLVRDKEHRALAHAAYLTLDRLTLADPAAALAPLAAQPDLMAGREQTRANFFARADVRDPQQKTLLEGYLLDPARSPDELKTFTGLYPNANYMISNNLLTATTTPAHAELAERDRAALATVETWLADPRFANLAPQLSATRDRLKEFVRQAAAP
jgi:hypothetical protein